MNAGPSSRALFTVYARIAVHVDTARTAGATGWLVKPFDPTSLLATVRKVLD